MSELKRFAIYNPGKDERFCTVTARTPESALQCARRNFISVHVDARASHDAEPESISDCTHCGGTGTHLADTKYPSSDLEAYESCVECNGTGTEVSE